jgi:hypothetical protein
VIGPSEPNYLKSEGFLSEVGGSSEADEQVNLPEGQDMLSGCNPVEGCCTSPDLGPINSQELQGLGVDDVEAAASVHEDLGEPNVADDRVNDERLPS